MARGAIVAGLLVVATLPAGRVDAQRAWTTPGESEATEARDAAARGDCTAALSQFDAAVAKRREDASLRRDRGLCHEQVGNLQPARDDYGAYLSMDPGAPDAPRIQARYDAVAARAQESAEPEPPLTPEERSEQALAEPMPDESGKAPHLPSQGFLLGAHLGYRDWNGNGIPGQTVSVGLEGGYAYADGAEIDVRAALLDSNEVDNAGFGLSAAHTFKVGVDDDNRWELMFGLGGGFETQQNSQRIRRNFFFARVTSSIRWSFHPSVVGQLGPELGLGAIPAPASVVAEDTDTVLALYWGGRVEVLWELEPRR
jgi:hypothetical protein